MIQDLICTREQSLALKELGMKEESIVGSFRPKEDEEVLTIPLKAQVFMWAREKHKIFGTISIDQSIEPKFCYSISKYIDNESFFDWETIVYNSDLYYTYEEAESACINKLIEIVKNK